MQILIATPKQKNKTQGNHVTAYRWARLMEECGHVVTVTSEPEIDEIMKADPDVLIACHSECFHDCPHGGAVPSGGDCHHHDGHRFEHRSC